MKNEIVISVKDLSKAYKLYLRPSDRLREVLHLFRKKYHREYKALRSISFEISKGQAVGIIGRNGSGKSTLLKILAGVLSPTSGAVRVQGKVTALLELGAGFNPELTGTENIYLNGTLLGFTADQIKERMPSIVSFADIGEFIHQPVRLYSSGMFVRLAFAVAINVDPDIIIVDEALAVGDVVFQQKCIRFLQSFRDKGGTILFVTHDMPTVLSFCDRAILISRGTDYVLDGHPSQVCKKFLEDVYNDKSSKHEEQKWKSDEKTNRDMPSSGIAIKVLEKEQTIAQCSFSTFGQKSESFGLGGMAILNCYFEDEDGRAIMHTSAGKIVKFCMHVKVNKDINHAAFGIMLKDRTGQYVIAEGTDAAFRNQDMRLVKNQIVLVKFEFEMPTLVDGEYLFNVAAAEGIGHNHVQHHWVHDAILMKVLSSRLAQGIVGLRGINISVVVAEGKYVQS